MDKKKVAEELLKIAKSLIAFDKPRIQSPWRFRDWEERRGGVTFMLQNDDFAQITLTYHPAPVIKNPKFKIYLSRWYVYSEKKRGNWIAIGNSSTIPKFDTYEEALKQVYKWMKEYKKKIPKENLY